MKDWSKEVQDAVEAHISAIEEWQEHYEEEGPEPTTPDPSFAPYDGCMTCIIREVLGAAYPVFLAAFRSGDLIDMPT